MQAVVSLLLIQIKPYLSVLYLLNLEKKPCQLSRNKKSQHFFRIRDKQGTHFFTKNILGLRESLR